MPEVLPTPTVTPINAPSNAGSSVRGTTLAHMQRLLATAAVVPLVSCTRSDTQSTQTVTIPAASSATTQDTTHGSLLPRPTATVTPTATTTTPDMGYAVVDPMPAPARCMGLAQSTKANATFKRDAGGLFLEVTLSLPSGQAWAGTTFTPNSPPSPWSGTLISSNVLLTTATARVRPSAGITSLGVQFSVGCPAGPGSIAVTASFPASPTDTTKVTLQKNDY